MLSLFCIRQLGRSDKGSDAQGILGFIGRDFAGRPTGLHTCLGLVERGQRGNNNINNNNS